MLLEKLFKIGKKMELNPKSIQLELEKIDKLTSTEAPEDDPFKFKYQAREILENLRKLIDTELEKVIENEQVVRLSQIDLQQDEPSEQHNVDAGTGSKQLYLNILLAALYSKLGANYIDCEETSSGEEMLTKSVDILSKAGNQPFSSLVYLYATNQLGILHSSRRNYKKAQDCLETAEKLYLEYKKEHVEAPYNYIDLLAEFKGAKRKEEDTARQWLEYEAEYTQTLYYLAQVMARLDEDCKSAVYCKQTLQRQLEYKQYVPVDWALNAATLSQYYITAENFQLARHCLASAMVVLDETGDPEPSSDEDSLYCKRLNIYRCWVKFAINLLEYSVFKLVEEMENEGHTTPAADDELREAELFHLECTKYEQWMQYQPIKDFSQAKDVFIKGISLIEDVKKFYSKDEFCSDYLELIQDQSKLYKYLIRFEIDPSRRSKMNKRRVDLLEDALKELNPQYYLLIYRQMVYELAEVYMDMVDCKVEAAQQTNAEPLTQQSIHKINQLSDKSILKFQTYISSLHDTTGKLPDPLPQGDERPCLIAWFCIGRLYYKIIKPDPLDHIEMLKKALLYYQRVVGECDTHPHYAELMKAELPACREMIVLLPAKLDKLLTEANSR